MKMYHDGQCENPECSQHNEIIEFHAEVADGYLVGVECETCRGKLRKVFSAPYLTGMTRKSAETHQLKKQTAKESEAELSPLLRVLQAIRKECFAHGIQPIAFTVRPNEQNSNIWDANVIGTLSPERN